jgi:hypothetical protein
LYFLIKKKPTDTNLSGEYFIEPNKNEDDPKDKHEAHEKLMRLGYKSSFIIFVDSANKQSWNGYNNGIRYFYGYLYTKTVIKIKRHEIQNEEIYNLNPDKNCLSKYEGDRFYFYCTNIKFELTKPICSTVSTGKVSKGGKLKCKDGKVRTLWFKGGNSYVKVKLKSTGKLILQKVK